MQLIIDLTGGVAPSITPVWNKVLNREGKANTLQIIDNGVYDDLYVGGFTTNLDSSSARTYFTTLSSHNGATGALVQAVSSTNFVSAT